MTRNILAAFAALALFAAFTACASYEGPDGSEAKSFGQGEVTFEAPVCPDPPPADLADCPTTTVTVESEGFSDVFGGMFGGLVESAAGFFGRGSPPDVNVTVSAPE